MEEAEEDARSEAVEGVHLEDVLEEVVEVRVHLPEVTAPTHTEGLEFVYIMDTAPCCLQL